ncbi:MAG: RDD family protein [Niabella sp.]
MPVVSIPTSFNICLGFDAPRLGRRMLALFIDMLIQYLYIILIAYMVSHLLYSVSDFNLWAIQLVVMCPVFLYHIILEIATNGQSVGKKIMKLRVVSINGGRPSVSQLLIRWLLRISDLWIILLLYLLIYVLAGGHNTQAIMAFLFGLGFLVTDIILVANSKKAQRIGDILAQTIVIKTNHKESLENTVFREVEADYIPAFPQVMRISDRDLNVIKKLLDANKKTKDFEAIAGAAEKVKAYLQIETPMQPDEFLDRLLKDYNYLSAK